MKLTAQSEDIHVARARQAAKAVFLRTLAERNYTRKDLLEIFGLALTVRLTEQSNPHNRIGKNFRNSHHHPGRRNPSGSKLLRRFIRRSKGEAVWERNAYAALTGRQYNHLNTPSVEV